MPFVKKLNDFCDGRAAQRGYIRLIDGARCRFDLWEPRWRSDASGASAPLPYDKAVATYGVGKIRRAHTRKAMNSLIQGSAARQMKLIMRNCWREKLVPLITMHDELCFSVSSEYQNERAKELMIHSLKLRVPSKTDLQWGKNWGMACEETDNPPSFRELMEAM